MTTTALRRPRSSMSRGHLGVAGPIPMPHNPLLAANRPGHTVGTSQNHSPMFISGFKQFGGQSGQPTTGDIVSAPDRKQPPMVKTAWQRESKSQTFGIAESYGMASSGGGMPQTYGVFPRIATQRRSRHIVLTSKKPPEAKRNLLFASSQNHQRTSSATRQIGSARPTTGNASIPRTAFSPEERKKVFRNLHRTIIQLPKFSSSSEEATFFRIIRWIEETNNAMACWDELTEKDHPKPQQHLHHASLPGLKVDPPS